ISTVFTTHYDEKMHADIRPRIEKRLAEAIQLMQDKDVFETDKEGNPTWKRLQIAEEPATVLFHFRRGDTGTRYFPTIKHANSRVDFMFRDALIICNFPAKMLVNGMLYHFEGPLEGKKLQPFLNKRYIEIPQSSEQTYFEKFVAPLIEKHHVYAEGFDIITERHDAVPVLKLSAAGAAPGLVLHFRYNEFLFPFSANPVSVKVHRNNGSYRFYRIKRSRTWEQK